MRKHMVWVSALMLLAGCAESLEHFHRGNKVLERHYIPGTWGIPGQVVWTECRENQLKDSVFWKKKVCDDTIESNAPLAIDRGSNTTQSYAQLVVPAAIHGAMFMGGMALLGTQMASGLASQPAQQGVLAGSSISTLNMRGTGPAFQGMPAAPLGGLQ